MKNILLIISLVFINQISWAQSNRILLNNIIDTVQTYSVKSSSIDWKTTKKGTLKSFKKNKNIKTTVNQLLNKLNDSHSQYFTKKEYENFNHEEIKKQEHFKINTKLINDSIAYIEVPSFLSTDSIQQYNYINTIQNQLYKYSGNNIENFVIDLSKNNGGNMWVMIAALAPIFQNDTLGYFIYPEQNSKKEYWILQPKSINLNNSVVYNFNKPLHKIKSNKIAILQSNQTASSGEALVVALKGNNNTKFFGSSTYGVPSSNQEYIFNDGSILFLTTAYFSDIHDKIYKSSIKPNNYTNTLNLTNIINWF